jgi:ATP synthase subunit C.
MIELLPDVASSFESVFAQTQPRSPEYAENLAVGLTNLAVGIAIGLAALATGLAQRSIGSAAVGSVSEDSGNLAYALVFTVIPETLIIFGFLTIFLLNV